jgi:hypothetical protein
MLIRTIILLTYMILVMISAVMSTVYFFFSSKQLKYYDIIEHNVQAREIMKTAHTVFNDQLRSYDYCVFLHEDTERFGFFEKKTLLDEKIKAVVKLGVGHIAGLSLTYRIIKNHNGELKAYSPGPGKGALLTAVFRL